MDANKDYIDKMLRKVVYEILFDGNVTICTNCAGSPFKGFGNCHIGCSENNGTDIWDCSVMNKEGYCCKCGCAWSNHDSKSFYFEMREVICESTDFGKKK